MNNVLMGIAKAGIKESGKEDLLVIKLPFACEAHFVFTTNHFAAAPVLYSKNMLEASGNRVSAMVINSGNANCGTGIEGYEHAKMMGEKVAELFDIPKEEVLVFSTGIIGKPLPIINVLEGIEYAVNHLEVLDLEMAAKAISTTDRFPKYAFCKKDNYEAFCFGKGAGMIHPNMATMLAFCFTNSKLMPRKHFDDILEKTFNSIDVDGCQSTNDSFGVISYGDLDYSDDVYNCVYKVCKEVSDMIVKDGEGATKIITIEVKHASIKTKAKVIANAIATSNLVKTAMFGADPNWGRILAAAGSTIFPIDPLKVSLHIMGVKVYDRAPIHFNKEKLSQKMRESQDIEIVLDLKEGKEHFSYRFSDLGYEYIRINAEYTT
jgi:glutamate N-acetyltransferase/amino-acid N-acetyltransferase